jgi:hypothetical protein
MRLLFFLVLASTLWAQSNPAPRHPRTPVSKSQAADNSLAQRSLEDLVQMQTEEIADLNDEVSRLRALVTMLRSDAGIVNSQTVRSALQVNADMWDSLMNTTQRRIERLQNAVQRENARLQIERHSQTPSSSVH